MPRKRNWHPTKRCAACVELARLEAASRLQERAAARVAALSRTCPWCLVQFQAAKANQKYCSDPHQLIAKSVRRKARLRGAAVGEPPTLGWVYARDGGRCALCLEAVDLSLRWPNTRCASLDHIVPISRGGKDGSDNVQLAHLTCNIRKNDKLPGEAKRPRRAA